MKRSKPIEKQIENPKSFLILISLFLITIIVIFMSWGRSNDEPQVADKSESEVDLIEENINGELGDYFGEVSESAGSGSSDAFMQSDPFRETCEGSGAGDKPSISFGTVCFR